MSVNNMSFEQAATLLNAIQNQVTGTANVTATNVDEFISVAQKTIAAGYDPVLNAITQVIGRTIFSIRPYSSKLRSLIMDDKKWGSITRKLSISDKDWETSQEFNLTDGSSVDPWVISKPNLLQMNYYGAAVYQRHYTIFKDQLDNAFRGPDEFGRFMTMVTQNCLDIIEQTHESIARLTIGNFVTGKIAANNGVIHLITEYNAETGENVTSTTVFYKDNIGPFTKWLFARIDDLTNMMTQRTGLYQIQVTGNEINRHSPLTKQKVYMYSKMLAEINARVKADTYHDTYLELSDVVSIPYWQGTDSRMEINMLPTYLQADGTLTQPGAAVQEENVLGVIFDEEAMGMTIVNQWQASSGLNPSGGYFNMFYHFTERWFNDFTEKGLVLVLD